MTSQRPLGWDVETPRGNRGRAGGDFRVEISLIAKESRRSALDAGTLAEPNPLRLPFLGYRLDSLF
ncbi:MAG TPA: hypothetical protein VHY20_07670 [Pirellulales bacterium]|nr:hypothetical protein [Pirellulales bacterium]